MRAGAFRSTTSSAGCTAVAPSRTGCLTSSHDSPARASGAWPAAGEPTMANVAIDYRHIAPTTAERPSESAVIVAAIPKLYALRRGLPAYYQGLLDDPDEILQVAAVAALLDLGTVPVERFPHLVAMSQYGAVKGRAFRYFLDCFVYRLAEQVSAVRIANPSDLQDAETCSARRYSKQ